MTLFCSNMPLFLAPMAGITDRPFRNICRQFGADVLITEMISTRGLYYNDVKTKKLLDIDSTEHPIGVQLFGNNPIFFAEAIEKTKQIPFDFVNINMGCPTPKIVKNGDGCALMKNSELSAKIIEQTSKSTDKPVTVKIRKGWDKDSINAVKFSNLAQQSGAQMIIIHARIREEFYQGKADWNIIKKIKQNVSIPVIGNGDVFSAEDARRMVDKTGCDGIMIGRGALGNPWIFREIKHYLATGEKPPSPSLIEKHETMLNHMDMAIAFHGERIGILEMRKHLAWYLKGLPHSGSMKRNIQQSKDKSEIKQMLEEYFGKRR